MEWKHDTLKKKKSLITKYSQTTCFVGINTGTLADTSEARFLKALYISVCVCVCVCVRQTSCLPVTAQMSQSYVDYSAQRQVTLTKGFFSLSKLKSQALSSSLVNVFGNKHPIIRRYKIYDS